MVETRSRVEGERERGREGERERGREGERERGREGERDRERAQAGMLRASSYRGTSLVRNRAPKGPYRRPMPRVLGGSLVGGRFPMGEVPLYISRGTPAGTGAPRS